jgi:hypothetical protein
MIVWILGLVLQVLTVPGSSQQYTISQRSVLILALDNYGLGNRLRALSDWYSVARLTNRQLLVSWTATHDCNAKFTSLFRRYPVGMDLLPFGISSNVGGQSMVRSIADASDMTYYFLDKSEGITIVNDRPLFDPDIDIVFTYHIGSRVLNSIPCIYYSSMKARFFGQLEPVREVQDIVESVWESYFMGYLVVGVHARMHDPLFDWAVVPPLVPKGLGAGTSGRQSAELFGEGASVQDFIRAVRGIMKHFNYKFGGSSDTSEASRSSVKLFVASNSVDAKHAIVDEFRGQALTIDIAKKSTSRNMTTGVQLALVEWLLLARCDMIVNSYGSSFAVEAAAMGNQFNKYVPIVSISNGKLLLLNVPHLPYCGNMLFLAAYSSKGVFGQYTEGTGDNRAVGSVALTLEQCSLLDNWGIEEPVYCMTTV